MTYERRPGAPSASGTTGAGQTVTTKTTTYTAAAGDFVLANASGGAFTVTLPAASATALVSVKKIDSSTNGVTVAPPSGTIDGAATKLVYPQYTSLDFVSDGTNWFVR